MTPAPDLEDRLRDAMTARAAQVTVDRLTPAVVPAAAHNWSRWGLAVGAVAASAAGVLVVVAVHDGEQAGYSVAAGGGSTLAGVGYDLPPSWAAVEIPAREGLRRACLTPDDAAEPGDGTCGAVELMVADPVPDDDSGGAVRTKDLGVDDCGDDYQVNWQIEETLIDGAPAHLNLIRCTATAAARTVWTLDGSNVALFVRDDQWMPQAESILTSMRISPELRESSTGEFYSEITESPTASPTR